LQIRETSGAIIWLSPTHGNSHCVLTLQQNGTLQLQTNDTHEFVSDIYSASGDPDVDWILYLDQTGLLYIRDLNSSTQLWSSVTVLVGKSRSLIWILVGVIGGVLLIVIRSVIWLYYAHYYAHASKQRLKWSHSTNIWFLAKWINNLHCES